MIQLVKKILHREYHFLNQVEIYQDNLLHNLKYLLSLDSNLKIAPVLKSNAYGHGLVEISQILDPSQAPFFCVDSLHEAYKLYKAKIKTPILIMGYFDPKNLKVKRLPFAYSLYDFETAQIINHFQKGASVHIKVDTGMHRMGIPLTELNDFIIQVKKLSNLKIEGLMSHLAVSDNAEEPLFKLQVKNFKRALGIIESIGVKPKWIHLSASNTLLDPKSRQAVSQISNLVRVGKALYGLSLHPDPNLKPVLQLTSKIAQIKKLNKGDRVGYDGIFTAPREMILGVLPVGYNDGVDRRLSNKGFVTVDNIPCRILGRVSMNITTIDLTSVPNPRVNQKAVIFSKNSKDPNSIENSAKLAETIAHELLVHIEPSTKRVVL